MVHKDMYACMHTRVCVCLVWGWGCASDMCVCVSVCACTSVWRKAVQGDKHLPSWAEATCVEERCIQEVCSQQACMQFPSHSSQGPGLNVGPR